MENRWMNIIYFFLLVSGVLFASVMMAKDYIGYKCNSEKYNVYEVKIVDTDYITRQGARWAYFKVTVKNTTLEGRVHCNWWEDKGDVIKVAYDNNYHFIRTEITFDDTSIAVLFYCTIMGGVMLFRFFKNK